MSEPDDMEMPLEDFITQCQGAAQGTFEAVAIPHEVPTFEALGVMTAVAGNQINLRLLQEQAKTNNWLEIIHRRLVEAKK